MARSIESIQADIAQQERDIKMYQDLLKGGTVQTGSVSAGRYKGYIVDRKDEIKRLKQELAEAKKMKAQNSFSNGRLKAEQAITNKMRAAGLGEI